MSYVRNPRKQAEHPILNPFTFFFMAVNDWRENSSSWEAEPEHFSPQNLQSQNTALLFLFPHLPAACHSTKWSSCRKITERTINLSKSVLAGKWGTKIQKQMLVRMEIWVCKVFSWQMEKKSKVGEEWEAVMDRRMRYLASRWMVRLLRLRGKCETWQKNLKRDER